MILEVFDVTGQVSVSFPYNSVVKAAELGEETEKRRRKMSDEETEREVIRIK